MDPIAYQVEKLVDMVFVYELVDGNLTLAICLYDERYPNRRFPLNIYKQHLHPYHLQLVQALYLQNRDFLLLGIMPKCAKHCFSWKRFIFQRCNFYKQ